MSLTRRLSVINICTTLYLLCFIYETECCPDGWLSHQEMCYHFSHDTESLAGAKAMCDILGGTVVEIENEAENSYLAGQASVLNAQFWIGLTDIQEEGQWLWINSQTPAEFTNWALHEPNNAASDENCVILRKDRTWNDARCHLFIRYICERPNE